MQLPIVGDHRPRRSRPSKRLRVGVDIGRQYPTPRNLHQSEWSRYQTLECSPKTNPGGYELRLGDQISYRIATPNARSTSRSRLGCVSANNNQMQVTRLPPKNDQKKSKIPKLLTNLLSLRWCFPIRHSINCAGTSMRFASAERPFFLILLLFQFALPNSVFCHQHAPSPAGTWTILIYAGVDSSSESHLMPHLEKLAAESKQGQSSEIILFIDRSPKYSNDATILGEDFTDSRLFHLNSVCPDEVTSSNAQNESDDPMYTAEITDCLSNEEAVDLLWVDACAFGGIENVY